MTPRNAGATPDSNAPGDASRAEQVGDVAIGNVPVIVVEGQVDQFAIPVSSAVLPAFYFQSALIDVEPLGDNAGAVGIVLVKERNAFLLSRQRELREGEVVNVRAKAAGYHVFFQVGNKPPGTKTPPAYMVRHRSEQDALNALVASRTEAATAETASTLEKNAQARAAKEAEDLVITHLKQQDNLLPVDGKVKRSDGDTRLDVPGATWMTSRLYAVIDIDHQASQPFLPAVVRVESEDGKKYDADLVDIGPYRTPNEEHLASIPGNRKARAIIRINDATDSHFEGMRITFKQANGLPTAWVAVQEWEHSNPFMRPKSSEQVATERRYQQRSITMRYVLGAAWIGDGVGDGQLDATLLQGGAIRFQKGYQNSLALEGEVMVAWTDNARFRDIALDGTMGELTRRAILGRAEIGIAARLGYKWIFTPRVALALQVARFEADYAPVDGGSGSAPDSTLELAPMLTFGAGVHRHLTDDIVAGAVLSAEFLAQSVDDLYRRGVNAGVYLGYGWSHVTK